ncbi:MAG: hypothetical protein Q9225_001487 [Loekoesia sp. 1 TL-2023]
MSVAIKDAEVDLIAPLAVSEQTTVMLTPLDNIMPRVYTRLVLAFSHVEQSSVAKLSEIRSKLVTGLEETIKQVPLLAGKVSSVPGGSGRQCVVPSEGLKLYIRDLSDQLCWSYHDLERTKFPLASLDGTVLSPIDFFSLHAEPEVAFAQINFLDYGVLLTFCVHHAIMDITGVATILRIWAKHTVAASTTTDSPLADGDADFSMPFLDRKTLLGSSDLRSNAIPEKFPQYRFAAAVPSSSEIKNDERPTASALPSMTAKIFHFPPSSLKELKDMGQPTQPSDAFVSTNDALSAFLWHSIAKARFSISLPEASPPVSALGFAVDGRSRLNPPLPPEYIGNVNIYAYASLPTSILMSPLPTAVPSTAAAIRSSIIETTDVRIRDIISFINSVPRVSDIVPGFESFLGPDVAVTNWNSTGLGGLQWGILGQVQAVRIPKANFDGLCIVLPKCGEGLDVVISLVEEAIDRLCDDDDWRRFVKVIG